jgi:ubiquinone/menaquinone biosynthesis C-methylase UbiE
MHVKKHEQQEGGLGWGARAEDGSEIWDASPIFSGDTVGRKDWLKLLFYPKQFFLYRYVKKYITEMQRRYGRIEGADRYVPRILDVGCGTGSTMIDLKKIFGKSVDVIGADVVRLQVDLANKKIKQHGVWAEAMWYDGAHLPLEDASINAIYTSDVLGHVEDVRAWLDELFRVLKPGGVLAMFSESKLGKHAYIRNYLMKHGINVDPHAEFHISLYSKDVIREYLEAAGFEVWRMYASSWAYFFVYPDAAYAALKDKKGFFFLKNISRFLSFLKKKTHPGYAAAGELYTLLEMLTVGRFVESQGYVILGRKK